MSLSKVYVLILERGQCGRSVVVKLVEHLAKNDPLPTVRRPLRSPSTVPSPLPQALLDVQDIGVGEVTEALNKYPGNSKPAERSRGCSDHSKRWAWT